MTTRNDDDLKGQLGWVRGAEAVGDALIGSFGKLADRLRRGVDITDQERTLLADLLSGKSAFKIAWADGRRRRLLIATER